MTHLVVAYGKTGWKMTPGPLPFSRGRGRAALLIPLSLLPSRDEGSQHLPRVIPDRR